ncbi:response regulator [Candidatus Scalindua japonica]|uniref:Response regulator n=1 Tax=Candidatus Scalindua japonica TaxID=1284222 RepID=A0A286TVD0_9BACT|nr:response regulator [Candidatus Scalindua japonica]GAX59829.1 response regulator [Candidatus Scalindua japonica]
MASILFVEKYKNQRLLFEQEFSQEGYDVTITSDGKDASDKVKTRPPDIIVMDVCILNISGVEAMSRILKKLKSIPLIIYTAYDSYKDVCRIWGADAYLVKSSDLTELTNKIEELLSKAVNPV